MLIWEDLEVFNAQIIQVLIQVNSTSLKTTSFDNIRYRKLREVYYERRKNNKKSRRLPY